MASHSLQMPEWLVFLRALCAFAEDAAELAAGETLMPHAPAAAGVSTVLGDPQRRIAVMGGREGLPRSLGSVYGGSIIRFLGGFRGGASRTIAMFGPNSCCDGMAVSRDGSVLLITNISVVGHAVHVYSVHTGALLRKIGNYGAGPLQFASPRQVWVASDGFVFVADLGNERIQILTPHYDFHSFVGVGILYRPAGVCANDEVIVVSELLSTHRPHISVFERLSGALLRRFGSYGAGVGQLNHPTGLCFVAGHRHVAVADPDNNRVSVFTLDGEFIRHVGVDKLRLPFGVVCSDAGELVVADAGNRRVVVFSASGEIVWTSETSAAADFANVAMHGSTIFGQSSLLFWKSREDGKCVMFP